MIKDYIVIDNILDNPLEVRNYLLSLPFNTVESFNLTGLNSKKVVTGSRWRGFRTENLLRVSPDKSSFMIRSIFDKVFDIPCEVMSNIFGHISTSKMTELIPEESKWHEDEYRELLAGVIYLNENPPPESGTWIKINGKNKHIENKFNRLVLYKASILHKPGNFFGDDAFNSRLTLTIFVSGIKFIRNGNVAEPGLLHRS